MDNFVLEVYGESEYTLLALKSVAAIFSFNDFMGLVYIFVVLGLFCAFVQFIYKIHTGFASFHMLILHFVGATILITLCIVPKSTVTVHDMVKNRFTEVYRVPTVLAFVAWTANDIENGLKDVVIGAAGPINDPTIVGRGEGLELLAQMEKIPQIYHVQDKELTNSVSRYMIDCANLEIALGKIPIDNLSSTNNLWAEFRSMNQAVFTEIHSGVAVTCKDAYTAITTSLVAQAGNAATTYCNEHNYEDANVFKCKNDLEFVLNTFVVGVSGQTTAQDAIINMFVADAYTQAMAMLSDQDPQSYGANSAYFKTVGGQYQSSIAAMKWLPAMIGMYRAMLLAIFPLCVLLVFIAPKKTVMWYLGGFTALVLWSVIDTILLSYFLTRLTNTFADIQSTGLGVQQLLSMPSRAMQILTQFGSARWGGMGLATAMTVGILGLTGHAFSNIAQNSAGNADSAARGEGGKFAGSAGAATAYQEGLKAQTAMQEVEGLRPISQMQLATWGAGHNIQNTVSSGVKGEMRTGEYGSDYNAGAVAGQTGFTESIIGDSKAATIGSSASSVGTVSGQEALANVSGVSTKAQAFYGDASRTQDILNNMKANNGKIVADDEIAKNLKAFGVKAGDNLDMQVGKDGNITRLGISGTRDGKDYQKTIGGDGLVATDKQSWTKGTDFRTIDIDSFKLDHSTSKDWSQSIDRSKTTDDSITIDSSYTKDSSKTTNSSVTYDSSYTDDRGRYHIDKTLIDNQNQTLRGEYVDEGSKYHHSLQAAMEKDSVAFDQWGKAAQELNQAERQLAVAEWAMLQALAEPDEERGRYEKFLADSQARQQSAEQVLEEKQFGLVRSLTTDMNAARTMAETESDSTQHQTGTRDHIGFEGKVGVSSPFVSGNVKFGTDAFNMNTNSDSTGSTLSEDKTFHDFNKILNQARNDGRNADDITNKGMDGVVDYYNDYMNPEPELSESPTWVEAAKDNNCHKANDLSNDDKK